MAGQETTEPSKRRRPLVLALALVVPFVVILILLTQCDDDDDAVDATGNGHDGSELGGVDYEGGAARLDGVDDAFQVANAPGLNPTDAITVAAWWTAADFVGAGNNSLVDKAYTSHEAPHYQYHLGVTGTGYTEGGNFGFWVAADGAAASVFGAGWTAGEL